MRIIVKENDKLLNYLLNNLTDLSHKKIKSFLTNEMINIKGKIITKYDYPIKKGDIIEIKMGEKVIKVQVAQVMEHALKGDASLMYKVL